MPRRRETVDSHRGPPEAYPPRPYYAFEDRSRSRRRRRSYSSGDSERRYNESKPRSRRPGPRYRDTGNSYHDTGPFYRDSDPRYPEFEPDHRESEHQRHRRRRTRSYDEDSETEIRDRMDSMWRSHRPKFRPAKDNQGNAITIDVPLQNTGGLMSFLSAKRITRQTTSKWLEIDGELERRYHCEKIDRLDVLSANKYSTDGEESAVLHYKKSSGGSSDGQFRWIHMQCKARSLRNFEHFVSRLSGIDEDEPTLIARLMQKVREEHEKVHVSGPCLEPVVLRCDGQESGNPSHEDKWVIFSCTPILSVEPLATRTLSNDRGLHRAQGLFQSHYPLELAQERDKEQVLQQHSRLESNRSLHVSQLWMFILSSGTIVTTSSESLTSLIGPSLRLEESREDPTNRRPTVIRMSDPLRRIFFFPLEECKTWFALMDKVLAVCHQEFGNYPEHYQISRNDGTQVHPSDWRLFHTEAEGSFINISVQMLTREAPDPPHAPAPASRSGSNDQPDGARAARSERGSTRPGHSESVSDVSDIDQTSTGSDSLRSSSVVEGHREKRQESSRHGPGFGSGSGFDELEYENHPSRRSIVDPPEQSPHPLGTAHDQTSEWGMQESDVDVRNKPGRTMVDSANDSRQGERRREENSQPVHAPDAGSMHMGALVEEPKDLQQSERSLALIKYERRNTSLLQSPRTNSIRANEAYPSKGPAFVGNLEIQNRSLPRIDPLRKPGFTTSIGQRRSSIEYRPVSLIRQKRIDKYSKRQEIARRERSQSVTRGPQIRGRKNAKQSYGGPKASSSQALLPRERPSPYQARRDSPPPNRVQRYPLAPPSDIIVNITTPSPDKTAVNDVYYMPSASREHWSSISNSRMKVRSSLEANSNCRKNDDALQNGEPSGNNEGPKAPAPILVQADEAEPYVRPVFLWPVGRPSEAGKPRSRLSFESHGLSDEARPKSNAHPPSKSTDFGGVAPDIAKREEQTLKAILESVDKELSSDKDYNMSLLNENEPTQGKLYRSIKPVPQKEIAAKMVEIAGTRDASNKQQSQGNLIAWQVRLSELDQHLTEMFEFFLPAAYPDKVSEKYFGAVMRLVKVISRMCEPQYAGNGRNDGDASPYVIIDISKIADLRVKGPTIQPSEPISECQQCNNREQYRTIIDAQAHLRWVHFASQPVPNEELFFWIADSKELGDYQLCADAQKLLYVMLDHCIQLRKLRREICHGVCANNVFDDSLYRLPSGLVKAFQRILVLTAYVAHTGHVAYRKYQDFREDTPPVTFIDIYQTHYIEILGYGAEGSFDAAKDELVLMSGAGDYSRGIGYEAIGPEYVMFLLLGDLYSRTHADDAINLPNIYREYAARLKYQVVQHPSKRLLSKIYAFRDEVNIVKKVMLQQEERSFEYAAILEPSSFRVTSNTRKSMHVHEDRYRTHILLPNHEAQIMRIEALENRIETLISETTQRVEILEEDHGKAILVFTIVTIIFLPLSFVTGLLGMNTADVRTSSAGQWLFWAIALPLTAVVVAVSVLIGYRSDEFREFLEKAIPKLKSRKIVRGTILDQYDELDEESIVSGEKRTAKRAKPKHQILDTKARNGERGVGGEHV